jgi:excisionase family DNA binding protein
MTLDLVVKDAVREVVREELERFAQEHRLGESRHQAAEVVDQVLDVKGVVALLPNTTAEAVCTWCRSGRLKAMKVGRGWMIKRSAVERFLSSIAAAPSGVPEPSREAARILSTLRGGD